MSLGFSLSILWLLRLICSRLPITNFVSFSLLLTVSFGVLILGICDYPVGGIRALIMFSVFAIGQLIGRQSHSIELLYFAAS